MEGKVVTGVAATESLNAVIGGTHTEPCKAHLDGSIRTAAWLTLFLCQL